MASRLCQPECWPCATGAAAAGKHQGLWAPRCSAPRLRLPVTSVTVEPDSDSEPRSLDSEQDPDSESDSVGSLQYSQCLTARLVLWKTARAAVSDSDSEVTEVLSPGRVRVAPWYWPRHPGRRPAPSRACDHHDSFFPGGRPSVQAQALSG